MTPLFTRALRPAAAAAATAAPDSMLIHHCGRHPSSFLLLTPPPTPPHSTIYYPLLMCSIPPANPSRRRAPGIPSSPPRRVSLTYLSACISPSSIFNTQLVLRILSYGGAPVFARPVAMAATWEDRRDGAGADGARCRFDRERGSDLRRFHMCARRKCPTNLQPATRQPPP